MAKTITGAVLVSSASNAAGSTTRGRLDVDRAGRLTPCAGTSSTSPAPSTSLSTRCATAGATGHCHWAYLREGERYQVPPEMRMVSVHVEGDV